MAFALLNDDIVWCEIVTLWEGMLSLFSIPRFVESDHVLRPRIEPNRLIHYIWSAARNDRADERGHAHNWRLHLITSEYSKASIARANLSVCPKYLNVAENIPTIQPQSRAYRNLSASL